MHSQQKCTHTTRLRHQNRCHLAYDDQIKQTPETVRPATRNSSSQRTKTNRLSQQKKTNRPSSCFGCYKKIKHIVRIRTLHTRCISTAARRTIHSTLVQSFDRQVSPTAEKNTGCRHKHSENTCEVNRLPYDRQQCNGIADDSSIKYEYHLVHRQRLENAPRTSDNKQSCQHFKRQTYKHKRVENNFLFSVSLPQLYQPRRL